MDISWIWKSMLIIIFGILLIRISGRRSISQLTISQTVIMISIGTLLIQPVSGKNIWTTFLIAAILIVTLMLLEYIQLKWDFTETLFTGRSKIVINNGTLDEKNLRKMRLSVDKLEMRLRQNGIENIKDVQWATIEPSGQLGYLLIDKKKFATKEDVEKVQETLNYLLLQLNNSNLIQPSTNQQNDLNSNLFSEIEGKHSPSPPNRLR
ncbi:DUF421 domain-containing protein [Cytobacillus kochii]|uniref:DUF421 domain-containing protein n=1 Tax=Cytobacillus kochii TaxID=859143 RepID=UPI001CD1C5F7|nr:YetF domain-containing protein [Cytobacillus kochii]MCA1027563.1 DUF421 domain-containing protein [Cytobacillus kochii]